MIKNCDMRSMTSIHNDTFENSDRKGIVETTILI